MEETTSRARVIAGLAFSALLFLLVCLAHAQEGMPFHADSWLVISIADAILETGDVSFSSPYGDVGAIYYPRGSHIFTALAALLSGLGLADLSIYLPPLVYAALGLGFYALARRLYQSGSAALCVLAATPFAISNYTLLGPSYLVPVAFGSLLFIVYLTLLLASKYYDVRTALPALVVFAALANTHVNTTLLAIAATFLFVFFSLLFDHRLREDAILLGVGTLGFLAAVAVAWGVFGADRLADLVHSYLFLEMEKPYQDYVSVVGLAPALLSVAAVYYISVQKRRRALNLLLPLFAFLVVESLAYWAAYGVFIRYRRVMYFMVLLTPLLAGYGLWGVLSSLSGTLRNRGYQASVRPLVAVGVTAVAVLGLFTHLATYDDIVLYVTPREDTVLTAFGQSAPDAMVFAHHLASFSLPYYGLTPLQLSPRHAGPKFRYESGLYRIYPDGSLGEFASFYAWLDRMHGTGTFDWLDRHAESDYYLYLPRNPRSTPDFDVVVDAGGQAVLRYNHGVARQPQSHG